jgi:hypothetical protein
MVRHRAGRSQLPALGRPVGPAQGSQPGIIKISVLPTARGCQPAQPLRINPADTPTRRDVGRPVTRSAGRAAPTRSRRLQTHSDPAEGDTSIRPSALTPVTHHQESTPSSTPSRAVLRLDERFEHPTTVEHMLVGPPSWSRDRFVPGSLQRSPPLLVRPTRSRSRSRLPRTRTTEEIAQTRHITGIEPFTPSLGSLGQDRARPRIMITSDLVIGLIG